MGMGSTLDTIIFLVLVLGSIFPFWRILQRAGLNPMWSLLVLIFPAGGFALVTILAFRTWPSGESTVHSTLQDVVRQVQGGR